MKKWLRSILCRLGVDAACNNGLDEVLEREQRMRTLMWRLEVQAGTSFRRET